MTEPRRVTAVRPPQPHIVRGICGGGLTSCGKPARLFPGGWYCPIHAPGAQRAGAEPIA